ncbi:MAG: hypothetical protein V1721_07580 [Pseudomonadota bacterium]
MAEKIAYKISAYLSLEEAVARFDSMDDLILALKNGAIVAEGLSNSDLRAWDKITESEYKESTAG